MNGLFLPGETDHWTLLLSRKLLVERRVPRKRRTDFQVWMAVGSKVMGREHESSQMREGTLERYFEIIDRRAPATMSRFIRWLRKPSLAILRWTIALLLLLGSVFSFLPVLGIWMLPLGLLLIAEDVPLLREPLLRGLLWIEQKWKQLKARWGRR